MHKEDLIEYKKGLMLHRGHLITDITDPTVKSMQVLLEEQSKPYFNFINSLRSEATKDNRSDTDEKRTNKKIQICGKAYGGS